MNDLSRKILIIDIETTNFLQRGGKIVEIGIVELDLSNGETTILFDELCHEKGITMQEVKSSWIVENSSMTVDDVRHSKDLEDMRMDIQRIIDHYPAGSTAYNNKFDFDFLEDRGFDFPKKLACPMILSTDILKLPGRIGYKWPKVQEAYDYFVPENDYTEQHRGADDAFHEARIVYELFKLGVFTLD